MTRLDASTVLLQWSGGGLFFLWVTTRRREVGIGYGWLLRSLYAALAVGGAAAAAASPRSTSSTVRDAAALAAASSALLALGLSVARRRAGVAGERARAERRRARLAAALATTGRQGGGSGRGPEFPPSLDLLAPAVAAVGLAAAAAADVGHHAPYALALARTAVGALFLGAVTDAMLLGHWYLVQPGLGRAPLRELVRWVGRLWPLEVAALVWPTGMVSVLTGAVDDGWGGALGWFWVACAVTTIALAYVTTKALEERAYAAVMAATGLLYLAILTAFGTDLVARAVLAP